MASNRTTYEPRTTATSSPAATVTRTAPGGGRGAGTPRWLRILLPALIIIGWFAVLGAGGSSFGQVNEVADNDAIQHLPADAEATQVHEWEQRFRDSDLIPAVVVYQRADGLTDTDEQLVAEQLEAVGDISGVVSDRISPAIPSEDGEALQVVVPLTTEQQPADTVEELHDALTGVSEGLVVAVTGPAGLSADIVSAFGGLDGLLLLVAVAAVLVILVIVYRSPMLPFIVLGTSLVALTGAIATVVALARADVVVLSGQTQGILMILVVGAATDYSLLYVARFREALREHEHPWQATWVALRGAYRPVLASGATVIAGLACLLLSDLNSNRYMGPVAIVGIIFAQLAALTLLPALMLWAGRRAFWPRRPELGTMTTTDAPTEGRGLWPAVARLVRRRPRTVWLSATALLVVAAVGLVGLRADGVPQSDFVLGHSEARDGQELLEHHFPGGSGSPTLVVADEEALAAAAGTLLASDGVDGVAAVSADSPSGTTPVSAAGVAPGHGGTEPAGPTVVDGRVMLQATLTDVPDSATAEHTVAELRGSLAQHPATADALVGGPTATALDSNDAAIRDRTLIIPLVLVVILLILMVLLRAVLVPVLLLATTVLSFASALGVSSLVFNHVLDFPGADPTVPMFGFIFLVALGIDYNIFLMVRVREESLVHGTRAGILRGLVSTGGVITSAGVVLAATFAALGVLPILFLAQIAFIVAFGVLVDTVLVRSFLVPALTYDIGPAIWWPRRLTSDAAAAGTAQPRG